MQVSTESSDRMLVMSVGGRLDFTTSSGFLRALEAAVADARGRALIVDCAGLTYVSSTGMRSFLIGARAAQAGGVCFLVCGLQKMVAELFEASGFPRFIPTHPDRAAAEAAVAP